MSEPVASELPPEKRSLPAILIGVVTSRDFALRLMIGAVGAAALGWLGPKGAFAGLVLSQLLADAIREFVTNRKWSVHRLWFVTALALLFDRMRRRIRASGATPVATPLVSTLAATVVVVGAFTAVDTARGQSLFSHRHTTFFGGAHHATAPSVRLPDGRVVTSSAPLTFRDVRVGGSSAPASIVLSSGSQNLSRLRIEASPATFRVTSGCPGRLPVHSSCSVGIVFQPNRLGHVEGRLTISFVNDPELTLVLAGTAVKVGAGATLEPPRLSFGQTRVGSTAPAETVTLRAGSVPVLISEIATGSKEFTVAANDCPGRLSVGSACRIRVVFAPVSAGARSATLTVVRGDGGRPLTAALTGTAVHAPTQATLTPARADFGSVQVGSDSTPVTFTLAAGSSALDVVSVTASANFRIGASSCSGRLAPGRTCTIQVMFAPAAIGGDDGTLAVARAGGARLTVGLHGVGVPPTEATLLPTHASFGTVLLGTRSEPTQFTLTAGSTALTDIKIASDQADYVVDGTNCGSQLAPHVTCTIAVAFVPSAAGNRSGTLTVERADGAPLTAPLTGIGLEVEPKLAPDHADFGGVDIGTSSAPTYFTLVAGSSALPIAGIGTAAKDYSITANSCPPQLDARQSCAIGVTFVPVAEGERVGALVVTRSDGGPQLSAALAGVGVSVPPTLSPATFDFGTVQVGARSATTTVTLSAGSSPFPYAGATTRSKDFRITANTCSGTLNPSSNCTISVVFVPIVTGDRGATLTITRTDSATPLTATLTGVGLAPYVVLSPASLDFGNVCTDCGTPSPIQKITLSNTGNAALTIRGITSSDPKHFAVANGSCGQTLAPGDACVFSVTFLASPGSWQATISLDADGRGQHSLAVSGVGVVG